MSDVDARAAFRTRVLLAYATIYLVWGSNFMVARIGVRDLPPMLFAAGRTFVGAVVLLGLVYHQRAQLPRGARQWGYIVLLSLLLLTFSSGLSTIALKHLPSNETALLSSTIALWMAGLGVLGRQGQPLSRLSLTGLLVGFAGAALLMWPHHALSSSHLPWQLLVLLATFSWASGTILFRNLQLPLSPIAFNASIMVFGALGMLIMGLIGGEPAQWHWEWRGVVAMLFLGVFGSAIAYTAYTWLIRHQPTDRVATFAYVNPLIATVLGWLVLGEALTPLQIAATIVIVAGVMIVTVAPR